MSILKTLTINGTTYNVTPIVPTSSVTLLANAWTSEGGLHSQVVEIPGVTQHTKVDLQPTREQLEEFHYKILAFVAENDGGKVTVYAIGDKPDGDHTIQITLTEVKGTGKIRGNTVGTTMPRPDWNQTDPTKADYIKNKPDDKVFIGDENTTFTEFYDAFQSGKVCIMFRSFSNPNPGVWCATNVDEDGVWFYTIDGIGGLRYGLLRSNGVFSAWAGPGGSNDGECSVFVGDDNTTVAEYYEAHQAGKMVFMRRPESFGSTNWVAYSCTETVAYFYCIDRSGYVEYGSLYSDGVWNSTTIRPVKTVNGVTPGPNGNVNVTLTDEQIGQIVDRVIETMPTWTGGSY